MVSKVEGTRHRASFFMSHKTKLGVDLDYGSVRVTMEQPAPVTVRTAEKWWFLNGCQSSGRKWKNSSVIGNGIVGIGRGSTCSYSRAGSALSTKKNWDGNWEISKLDGYGVSHSIYYYGPVWGWDIGLIDPVLGLFLISLFIHSNTYANISIHTHIY